MTTFKAIVRLIYTNILDLTYNLGNTVTQAIAPIIAAAVISIFGHSAIFFVSFGFALVGGICMLQIKSVAR